MTKNADILILGSGFGGALLGAILAKAGRTVVIVDKATHPRFAIGESSTPLADSTLADIATTYDLPELLPLTQYGSWKRTHPELTCGLKRGFSYFGHPPGHDLTPDTLRDRQLLVSASSRDEVSDTHWLRSDVDTYFADCARRAGAQILEGAEYLLERTDGGWTVQGTTDKLAFRWVADVLIDAAGTGSVAIRTLKIPDRTDDLQTNSRALYAHFANVQPVGELLSQMQVNVGAYPFPCDAAAVHHVLDNGWMWQLPFDDGTVSVGFMFGAVRRDSDPVEAMRVSKPEGVQLRPYVWQSQLQKFPFLRRQFEHAKIIRPDAGLRLTGRLQRLTSRAAGWNWAALPHTAGFVDPLHSTGIAHTLFGIRRLADVLLDEPTPEQLHQRLSKYSNQIIREIRHIDRLVEGCYAALPSFRLWCAWTMLYFAAVTSMEQSSDGNRHDASFLLADDVDYVETLMLSRHHLGECVSAGAGEADCDRFEAWLREAIKPWNTVGLLDPDCGGMYPATAAR